MRIRLLDVGNLAEVVVEGAVGDEFDVVQAEELSAVVVDAAVAGRDVDDRFEAERLPDGPAPAGVERPADLVLGVGRRGAGLPERVRRLYAAELDTQIRHGETLRGVTTKDTKNTKRKS